MTHIQADAACLFEPTIPLLQLYAGPGPVRLLKFMTTFGVGGTEKQVVDMAQRLDRRRFDLSFGCLKRWGGLLDEVEAKFTVTEYPIRSFYECSAFHQQYRFMRALQRQRIQIVHSYNFYANVFSIPAAKLAGVPCVVASIRDMGVYMTPMQLRVQRWMCGFADRIVVNAEAIRNWLIEQGYRADKIRVIRNGLDLSKYGPKTDGVGLRRQFSLPPGAPLVVMLSRLNPQKGVEYFLEAAALVRQRCPDARFLVVGEAHINDGGTVRTDLEYRRKLEALAAQLGISERLSFTGMRSDVPDILAAASVSVHPSFSEGISNSLLESMAAGVPVVATHVGGTPEVIQHKHQGLLVPPRHAAELADAICTVLGNPFLAARLCQQARARIAASFSFDSIVRETEQLYAGLLLEKTVI